MQLRSSIFGVQILERLCLNFRTVSPCEGVKGTYERKKLKLVENSSGAFKVLR